MSHHDDGCDSVDIDDCGDNNEATSPLSALMDPGSTAGATLNLAIATVGAGLLSLPVAFYDAGIVLALGTLLVVAVFTVISIRFLTQATHKLNLHSYEDLSRELLGPSFESIARYMLLTYNIAVCISYIIIIGQMIEPLQTFVTPVFPILATSKHTMVAFWFVVMLPMSLVRNISSLRYSSFLAIAAAVYLAAAIVYRYFVPFVTIGDAALALLSNRTESRYHHGGHDVHRRRLHVNHEALQLHPMIVSLFTWHGALTMLSMPVLMFSYDCQVLVFEIYHSLARRTVNKMTKVAFGSVVMVSVLYGAVGLFGYLSHGQYTQDNILSNYNPEEDVVFAFAYALYVLPVVMAYTLMLFPTRDSIFNKLYGYSAGGEAEVSDWTFRVTSILLGLFSVVVAVVVPGMTGMIALVGGMCSSTLTMIYPAAFRMRLNSTGLLKASPMEKRAMYAMMTIGVFGFTFGTISGATKAFGLAST